MLPNPAIPVSDELLEWALKIALEYRRRVKEQQKRIGSAEFRNTHFSYRLGEDGIETFITTPELHSENTLMTILCRPDKFGHSMREVRMIVPDYIK
jgi:ATP-dependent Lon protease